MTQLVFNPLVDKYMVDGCMRCKYGATPQCKVIPWQELLETLRQIVIECGLTEEIKWGVPVYTYEGKNIASVNALKHSANLSFFKGALLKDEHKLLQQQGNIQLGRIIKFVKIEEIEALGKILSLYIREAIEIEKSGKKLTPTPHKETIPEELIQCFDKEPLFKNAFEALTPGRHRAYLIHFAQAKQSSTRLARIEKHKDQIYAGIGLHDEYKSKVQNP
jgi:uncharacterized protein YdeI (YjbR/CyaY-like superfamily)